MIIPGYIFSGRLGVRMLKPMYSGVMCLRLRGEEMKSQTASRLAGIFWLASSVYIFCFWQILGQ